MTAVTVNFSDETAKRIERAANELGVSKERLIEQTLEEKLADMEAEFETAANRVMEKNEELYRRLA